MQTHECTFESPRANRDTKHRIDILFGETQDFLFTHAGHFLTQNRHTCLANCTACTGPPNLRNFPVFKEKPKMQRIPTRVIPLFMIHGTVEEWCEVSRVPEVIEGVLGVDVHYLPVKK
jgi:hypothetical protein